MSKKKHRAGKLLLAAAVVAGAAGGGWFYYENGGQEPETEAISYKEETVKYGSVVTGITEDGVVSYGTLEQEVTIPEVVEVSFSSSSSSSTGASSGNGQMSGNSTGSMMGSSNSTSSGTDTALEIEEVYVASGQTIKEGDALMKLTQDSIDEYRSQLEASVNSATLLVKQEEINAESNRAKADYTYAMYIAEGKTAEETYQATITSLENAVTDLEEELQESADLIAEYEEDAEDGEDVEDELEEEQLNYSTIEANLQIARNNLTTKSIEAKQTYENAMTNYQYADQLYEIDTDGLEDDLNDAQSTLQEAQDALDEFDELIGDGVIYAEYTGTVMSIAYSEGDTLTSDSVAVTYLDPDNATMTVSVTQEDISEITIGDEVSIELTAYEDETFSGEVSSIATSASAGSSTVNYEVEITMNGDIGKVYSGMTGEVTFVEKQVTDVLYISNRAVHQDGTRSWVKVMQEDGSIEEVTIETGFSNGSIVEVTSGLSEGQTVLLESQVSG
jgi:HlyD family secretion protein